MSRRDDEKRRAGERPDREPSDAERPRPLERDEMETAQKLSAPAGAAAGAAAGATAGMVTGPFGPFGALVGALVGAAAGSAVGATEVATARSVEEAERTADYERLWNSMPGHADDRSFESMRPALRFGYIAAQHPDFIGRDFSDAEPELRRHWPDAMHGRTGNWEGVRRYVEHAYSHARAAGLAERRDPTVIGSAGSAVDPVERERYRTERGDTGDAPQQLDDEQRESQEHQAMWRSNQGAEEHGGPNAVG